MASVGEGDCHKDPNFAVVCSFLDKYGVSLGLEPISYSDLQTYLEDTTGDVSRVLIDIHVRLLRRIGKSVGNSTRFEKSIIRFCHNFSEFDAWEVESYGYKHAQLATKLRILKNLLECQFDYNIKFKEKINGESAEEMRLLPIGRDKEGQAYWYFLDHDLNLLVYKEEQDDEVADTWKLVCSNRTELASLVNSLQKVSGKEEEDKASTCESRSSKEGSPEKDVNGEKVAQDLAVEVKKHEVETDVKGKQIIKEDEDTLVGVKKKEAAIDQFEIVKKEAVIHEEGTEKGDISAQGQVVDSIRVKRTNKKAAEVVKKEKPGKESFAKKGKRVEVHLVDIMKEQKSIHEEMDADSEKVLKEPTGTVVKTENTLHVAENKEIKIENSDKVAVSIEAETDKSIPLLDSGHERVESEAETVEQISNDTNNATTDECQDSDKKSGHSGDLKSSKILLPSGQKSAEVYKLTASVDGGKVPDDAGGGNEAQVDESVDKSGSDCRLQTAKSPELEASPLSEKTSSCEDSSTTVLSETRTEENTIEIQERNPVVAEQDQVKTKIDSEVSTNQTEDASSTSVVDLEPAEVKFQSEVDQEKPQVTSEIVEGSSDGTLKETPDTLKETPDTLKETPDTLKETPCSTEENTDTEKTTLVSSDKLEVQPDDKMSSSGDPVFESKSPADGKCCTLTSSTLTSSTVEHKTTTESIQVIQERPASEPKDQQADCEALRVETKSELNDGAVDLCITAKEVLENIPPPTLAADDDTDTMHPESCDTSISSADLSSSRDLLQKHKKSDITEKNQASMQLSPEPGKLDQADPKSCCQDSSSSVNEKSMTEITSEGLSSGASPSSPHCLSVNADKQQEKSNKHNESHSNTNASSSTLGDLEATQNTNVDEADGNTDICESDDQPENSVEVKSQKEPENSVEKSQKEPENSEEENGKKDHDKSVDVPSQKEPANSVEVSSQKEPENPAEGNVHQEPENSVEITSQKEPENPAEENFHQEPENSVEVTSQKEPENPAEEKVLQEPENSGEVTSQKVPENSVEVMSQKEAENSVDVTIQKEPENSVEVSSQKEPEISVEVLSQKEPETSVEVSSQKEPETSVEVSSQKEPENSAEEKSQMEPENSAVKNSQKEPENSAEENGKKEPENPVEVTSQKEPENSAEKNSQKEPESSAEENGKKEPENPVEVTSQKEPENSAEKNSQKEPESSAEENGKKEPENPVEETSQKEPENSAEQNSQKEPENSAEEKSQKESEKDPASTKIDNISEMELTETCCETSVNIENPDTNNCEEPMNEESENKQENVANTKTVKDIKTSRRKRKVGKNSKKKAQMVNGHTDNSDSTLNQISEKPSNETANDDGVKCDDANVDDSFSRRPKRSLVSQIGRSALRNRKCAVKDTTSPKSADSAVNDTFVSSENLVPNATSKSTENALTNEANTNSESSMANDIPRSNTPSRRKLKRSVPEPASDEPVDSEPNGKRAKQTTKAQKTRAGRNAAARGRSARMITRDSESDDSDDTPLSQVRSRGQGLARGAGGRRTRGQACQRQQTQPNKESAQDEEGEEGNASKLGKKKKPDSSTEVLSEEDATPAKKGRNQTQASTPTNSKKSNKSKGSVGKKPAVQTTPAPAPEDDKDDTGMRRSLRVRQQRARRPPTPSSTSETSEETSEEFELSSEEEEEHDNDFLDSSFTPEEDSGDEEFMPKGRNFQRQAARTSKEEAEAVVNDDTPCVKCGKYNHPEMILLCDKCDAGYHTACLRPPLMLIPDGDWFCPPCEHAKLVEKLLECLQSFDLTIKKKVRLNKRQERLAFVGISISNILHGDRKGPQSPRYSGLSRQASSHNEDDSLREVKVEGEEAENHDDSASTSSYESKPEPKRMYRSERLALRQAQKRSRKDKHRHNRNRHKRSPDVEVLTQRTCRTRGAVSYQFKEFDELINNAIEDDKPFRREKPPGISRGKDMSNILGASDEEDEKIRQRDGEEIQPPPVVKKKGKRRLTKLDSDEDADDDEEESDEFKLSEEEDSDATECEVEEDAEDDESGSSDSGNWQPKRTWYNAHATSRRAGRRLHNFVVDDDYNSDENAAKRRSTRNSNRGRIHYSDWDSNEETEEDASGSDNSSDGSLYGRKKSQKQSAARMKQKGASRKKQKDSHDSDSSITIRRKNLRRLIKKRRKDESESEDSEKEAKSVKEVQKKEMEHSEGSHFVNEEESHEESDDSPRFKKKNVLRSSDEDETEPDVTDLEPVVEASEVCSKSGGTTEVDTLPAAAAVAETEEQPAVNTKPDNTISMNSDIDVETKPDNSEEMKSDVDVKTKPDTPVKTKPDNSVKAKVDIAVKTKPDNSIKVKSDIAVKTKPDNPIKMKSDIAVRTKPRPKIAAKGKKRSDWCEEDKVTIPVTDVAVPGKVRRMSTSDREPESVVDTAPLLPVPEVSVSASEKKPQLVATESKVHEKVPDVGMSPVDQKTTVSETEGSNREPSPVKEKPAGSGKKRTVPNFLDVNSGEESDEQKQDQPKGSAAPSSFIADVANVQTTAASQISSDGAKTRVDHVESPQHHINFSRPDQHYQYGAGSYSSSAQGAPYAHRQVTGSPQNIAQMGREPGPPPQNANMLSAAPHNGPPGLIRGFPDPMPHQPGSEGSAVGQGGRAPHPYTEGSGGRAPHSYTARGPRPNLAHSFPPGVRHSSQGVEPGQNMSKVNPEHCMPHPGFQGMPVGHYPPGGPAGGHMRPGQAPPHRGMQPPFYMGPQQHARPGMENDSGSNMGNYIPQNYGARRMPSAAHFGQDLSANAVRNPYYGMQTSPPHNMGQHFSRQYPVGMGPGPHNMSSPLTSMGQMARKLGSGSDMHSPPNTQNVGSGEGPKERRSSLGSPPNPEAAHRQEKLVDIREIKTESNDDDLSVKKVGKKRTVSSKSKKKTPEPNMATHDISQQGPASATSHGPASATSHGQMAGPAEGQDRVSGPGHLMGNYRVNSQPYHMPPYQMPYPHGSNVNPLQMTQGPYMNPRHTPPATAHQRPKADVNNASVKNAEGKWSRAESMESQCGSLPNRSPVHMSSYHQNFPKSQPSEQTISSQERRHSLSPGSQASEATSSDRMKDPASVDQMSMRKQATVDVKPHIQGLPPTAHTTETSPDFGGPPAGQTVAPTSQDHRLHANTPRHNIPQYSQGGGPNSSEAPRAYYNPSSYYPRGPDPRKPMSQNNTWNPDPQGHGLRYGPAGYPYGMNPNAGNRMPTIKSEFGSHSHSNSDLAGVPEKVSTAQDSSTKDDPVNMVKVGEQHRPVLQRSTSSEFQMVKNMEPGQTHPKNVELDIKPNIRHTDAGPEGAENMSLSEPQRPQASLSESVSSSSSSSATSTSPSAQTKLVAHDVTPTASMCKQATPVEPPSFHHSTSSGMNQPHQVSPVTSMAPHSPWPRPNSTVQYPHQHMNQWANMGGPPPSHYNMNRSYGGPGVMPHPAYGMDSQSSSIRPNPGQLDQKPFMHPNYESRFQPPYPGMRPAGPETEYHRAGFNPDYSPAGRYPPQMQNCPRRPDVGSHQASHASDVGDQVAESNTVSKPKRAKTQRKTGKEAAVGPMRGKSSKGRGRGRGGFMIDNLLQARGGEVDEGEDSSEMNDIVSYVTTDEYFKQQTSCDSFKHAPDVGVAEKKL